MSRRPPITAGGGDENLGPLETVGPDDSQSEAFESLLRQVARVPLAAEGTTGEPEPGVVIADRFEILREIGRGGFARVFEARDRVLSRSVAIKLLKRRRRLNDSEVELFYREARATARLNDPRIVTAYDWGVWNGAPFLVLELLDGEPLQTLLARGPLGETRAWGIVSQIAQALAYAHSLGVLHLDLKSQNVFVLQDGRIKVLDFGLAGLDWEEEVPGQLTRVAGGTPATMAPEQADSTGTDARADIWAVGVIVHQMLFGRMPEKLAVGADRVSVPAGASTRAQAVLARTLARDPRARYPDAEALAAAVTDTSGRSRPGRRMPNARTLFALAFPPLLVAAVGFWQLRRTDYFWRNPLAGARYERLTDFEGGEHSAAISRDGKSVAFLSSRDGPVGVFITQIGTGTFRNLTRAQVPEQLVNREIRTLQFSPDGGRLYFWVGESDTARRPISTWVVPIGGGEPRLVYEQVPELAWSPDGRSLAWHTSAPGDPMFVQATTGETRPLYSPGPPRHAHFQTWSPDGEFIYFVQGSPPSQMDIWRIRPTGGPPERITFHNSRVSYPTFLDRSTLLYLATGANQSGPWIYGLDVERRMPHRLTAGVERWTSFAASASGRRLVATATQIRPSLWQVPLSGHPAETVDAQRIVLPTAEGHSPMLAPGGLLYVSSDGSTERIWKLADGRTTQLWNSSEARLIGGPSMASSGERIAFAIENRGETRLLVMNADGSGVQTLVRSLELRGAPVWSPDGASMVIAANEGGSPRLYRVVLRTGEARRISEDYALDPAWAPGGEFLVYSGVDPGTTFPVKAVTEDGRPYPIPELTLSRGGALGLTQVSARRLRFLPGTKALVVLRGDIQHKDLWACDLTSGRWRQLTNFSRDIVIGDFDVAADGSAVVFERVQERSDIVVIDRAD